MDFERLLFDMEQFSLLAHCHISGWNLARSVLERLPELGISIDSVTRQLEDERVAKFNEPFHKLMETLAQRSSPHLVKVSSKAS